MDDMEKRWRKSSYSGNNGGGCVEAGNTAQHVLVRDSKDRQGPVLKISPAAWRELVARVKDR
jgi:Domain of unknown function (DUF397)